MNQNSEPAPQFNGECAFAVSLGKKGVIGREDLRLVQNGKTYLFSNAVAKLLWKLIPGRKEKAESNWSK